MTDTFTVDSAPLAEVAERVLTFVGPIIGFAGSHRFALRRLGAAYDPFLELTSLDEEGLGFIVVPPGALFRDYVVEIPDSEVARLSLQSGEDVEILTLVTRHPGATPTANLMGPIVTNRHSGEAAQVVLAESPYGVAVPVDAGTARDLQGDAPAE